jgi:aminoglycoside phosphotransferase family enzyme
MSVKQNNVNRLPEYIEHLLLSASYPHPVGKIELLQTHISFVILAGEYVYKWKKPVNFGFVDFSSLAKRKFYCERELVLNRRLCPEIYLETLWLCRQGQSYRLKGEGEIVEYGVKMVRMPEEGMLNKVIAAGQLQREHLSAIVDILVPFYRQAEQGPVVRENGRMAAVARTIANSFAQTKVFVGSTQLSAERFARIKKGTDAFLQREEIFLERIAGGAIRDCHGDLYSNNICLADNGKIYIFDCLEFNDRLRFIDICADVAFLAMDLDFHGLFAMSDYFMRRFIEQSAEQGLAKVLDFYKCYRAYVRGKVGMLAAADQTIDKDAAEGWAHAAGRYFQLAEEYAGRL